MAYIINFFGVAFMVVALISVSLHYISRDTFLIVMVLSLILLKIPEK